MRNDSSGTSRRRFVEAVGASGAAAALTGSPSMNFVECEVTPNGLLTEDFSVAFDSGQLSGVAEGDHLTLGVGPEDVYLWEKSENVTNPTQPIAARTDVLEPIGDEIFVYLLTGGKEARTEATPEQPQNQLLMSVDPSSDIAEDEDVEVVLDRERIHLFDTQTGKAISHGLEFATVEPAPTETEAEGDD
jgi:multiple sugar transport system ATP-binding protein